MFNVANLAITTRKNAVVTIAVHARHLCGPTELFFFLFWFGFHFGTVDFLDALACQGEEAVHP